MSTAAAATPMPRCDYRHAALLLLLATIAGTVTTDYTDPRSIAQVLFALAALMGLIVWSAEPRHLGPLIWLGEVFDRMSRGLRESTPNLWILASFRVLFGLLTVVTAFRELQSFEIQFYRLDYSLLRGLVKSALCVWAVIGLAVMLGVGGRWLRFANLLISAILLRNSLTFGIFESTYVMNAWLAAVTPCDARLRFIGRTCDTNWTPRVIDSSLLVYFIGIHFGFIFLYVGLDKLLCPLWFHGDGFYSFCTLPWVLPQELDGLTDNRPIMTLGNYGGLLVETLFLFAWAFKLTRPLAVLGIGALAFGLCIPFNIFLIGPFAVTFAIGLSSILFPECPGSGISGFPRARRPSVTELYVWHLIPLYSLLFFVGDMLHSFRPDRTWREPAAAAFDRLPVWQRGEDVTALVTPRVSSTLLTELAIDLHVLDLWKHPWRETSNWFFAAKRYSLFSKRHTLGMYGFRIVIRCRDGTEREPMVFFRPNLERPGLWGGVLELNLFQGSMYVIGDCSRIASHGKFDEVTLSRATREFLAPFMQQLLRRAGIGIGDVDVVEVQVKPMNTSIAWAARVEQDCYHWTVILRHDPNTKRFFLGDPPERQPIQGRDARCPDYLPYYHELDSAMHPSVAGGL